jgi:hypothetical protein
MSDDIARQLDALQQKIGQDMAKAMRQMVEVMSAATKPQPASQQQQIVVPSAPLEPPSLPTAPRSESSIRPMSDAQSKQFFASPQPVDPESGLGGISYAVPRFTTPPKQTSEPLAPPTLPTTPRRAELPPPKLDEFREAPPPPTSLELPQPYEPPRPPLSRPVDQQDLRHGFPYGHPYQTDVAEMQLYDEAVDDTYNVAVQRSRTEHDYRRKQLELDTQTQYDLNNDYRQLDDLTRRAELSRETVTDINI